jgi:5-methylcytosine-specific restriction protein A
MKFRFAGSNSKKGGCGSASISSIHHMTSPIWNIQPGEDRTRTQIHDRFKGSRYRGIESTSTGHVMVYSDPKNASRRGYDFDGWDLARQVFYYTGHGPNGNQRLEAGNKQLVEHDAIGKPLRLFIAVGTQPNSNTRIHRYVGEFKIDPANRYFTRIAPGDDGIPRAETGRKQTCRGRPASAARYNGIP